MFIAIIILFVLKPYLHPIKSILDCYSCESVIGFIYFRRVMSKM